MKATTPKSTTKRRPFSELALDVQVRRLLPIAREFVLSGLPLDQECVDGRVCLDVLEPFVGHDGPDVDDDESTQIKKTEQIAGAAFAFGIAIGQLVSPVVFAKGGAR